MPNIQSVLKEEIARVARKELKSDTTSLKKASAGYRSDIAALKRRLAILEALVGKLAQQASKAQSQSVPLDDSTAGDRLRFRAQGLLKNRERLGLSASDTAKLLGASPLSVYKWEKGQAKPRKAYLPRIAALRSMGKKEAQAKLAALEK
jgi:DNA-binding transcriptional regulator YiaG